MKIDPCEVRGFLELDDDMLVDFVARMYTPEEVYAGRENELHEWAIQEGYSIEESDDAE
jgi:hypothetical protein